jgi:teichuronic acid biosynthesis glycosyltransferase TuaC
MTRNRPKLSPATVVPLSTHVGARLLVFSSLFPSQVSPTSGTFIKERMFRVSRHIPVVIVAPQAWSPLDGIIRLIRKSFRPTSQEYEVIDGVEIYRPRVFSFPAVFKQFDGHFMAWGSSKVVKQLVESFNPTIIDAHFGYPDGFAASFHARRFQLPLTITLRGSKDEWLLGTNRESFLKRALGSAHQLFAVSDALKRDIAVKLLGDEVKCEVIGNGVDLHKFQLKNKVEARRRLGISVNAKVIISVGGLIDRKGFHRVIPLIKNLKEKWPELIYLVVGGGVSHGDMTATLKKLAIEEGVSDRVRFCGAQLPVDLCWFYSAADVFALATEHEGWANVFLEAMACGLPVISTLVGGNAQVVKDSSLGLLSPFWEPKEFEKNLDTSLSTTWDTERILAYAHSNSWDQRVKRLVTVFESIANEHHKPVEARSS